MDVLRDEIRAAAEAALADLVGFAARERFDALEPGRNPFTLFPGARAAVVIARRITRGTLRGVEEGVNFGDYGSFGQGWLAGEFLTETLYETAAALERRGWEAMPLIPGLRQGVPGVSGPVDPDFSWAAVACGLGEIGMAGEVLTPRFGPRQRFALLLTDAPLPSDPLLERSVCIRCGRCAALCPLSALGPEVVEQNICGISMPVYACRREACAACQNGAVKAGYLSTVMTGAVRHNTDAMDRLAALCTRTCVAALEEAGALESAMEQPFRRRPVWRKDEFGGILPPLAAETLAADAARGEGRAQV